MSHPSELQPDSKIQQVASENKHGKAERGKALLVLCLLFTVTPRAPICEESSPLRDAPAAAG